mmetsp:Transcript_89472/g.208370  ORF Transcript_89472/g.208370 Transcript_89472/m.208370 type:complete len:241 (+) Transcript_89472:58-780(+)
MSLPPTLSNGVSTGHNSWSEQEQEMQALLHAMEAHSGDEGMEHVFKELMTWLPVDQHDDAHESIQKVFQQAQAALNELDQFHPASGAACSWEPPPGDTLRIINIEEKTRSAKLEDFSASKFELKQAIEEMTEGQMRAALCLEELQMLWQEKQQELERCAKRHAVLQGMMYLMNAREEQLSHSLAPLAVSFPLEAQGPNADCGGTSAQRELGGALEHPKQPRTTTPCCSGDCPGPKNPCLS